MTYILVILCVILLSSELNLYFKQRKNNKEDFSPLEILQNQKENSAETESMTSDLPIVLGKYNFNEPKIASLLNGFTMRDEEKLLAFSEVNALILLVDYKAKISYANQQYYPVFIYNHNQHKDYYTNFRGELVVVEQFQNASKEWKSLNYFKFSLSGIGKLCNNECLVLLMKKDKSVYLNKRIIIKKDNDVIYSLPSRLKIKSEILY